MARPLGVQLGRAPLVDQVMQPPRTLGDAVVEDFGQASRDLYALTQMPTPSGREMMTQMMDPQSEVRRNALEAALAGITAYHGSPYKFDKFDMSKIGTGEGAQAYGHGLYFAENPEVARNYRPKGWKPSDDYVIEGKPVQDVYNEALKRQDYAKAGVLERMLMHEDKPTIRQMLMDEAADGSRQAKDGLKYLESIPDSAFAPPSGNLYKVDIPDEAVGRMLDWDKPLSQQPESVRDAIQNLARDPGGVLQRRGISNPTEFFRQAREVYGDFGNSIIRALNDRMSHPEISNLLKESGIPGIKYLDQGSRFQPGQPIPEGFGVSQFGRGPNSGKWKVVLHTGEAAGPFPSKETADAFFKAHDPVKTSNFVLFDENLAKILERK